ncbi:hypothetical protein ACFO0N_17430 [Halobium salinum]|uniref:C2H2-type domain-containing protein n=1 Tax=Halobium salinum TaxID=1364940 RepID=A0ABD5PG14_9EURY|nr:hypothetical protein [Halobium salinum]
MGARHYRCKRCGRDFADGETLRDHLRRRHPAKTEARWWVATEKPDNLQFER